MSKRLFQLIFQSSTEYTELMIGIISLIAGLWLFDQSLVMCLPDWMCKNFVPDVWGSLLIFSGFLKILGVWNNVIQCRILSCFIAMIVWLTLGIILVHAAYPRLIVPVSFTLSLFNALIFMKLAIMKFQQDRNMKVR